MMKRRRLRKAHREYLARRVEDLRISLSEVERQRDELLDDVDRSCAWAMNVMDERDELQRSFNLFYDRLTEATNRWRDEDPDNRALIMPDLGDLMQWLLDRGDNAIEERNTLRARIHKFIGGPRACEGGRYCRICLKPLEGSYGVRE